MILDKIILMMYSVIVGAFSYFIIYFLRDEDSLTLRCCSIAVMGIIVMLEVIIWWNIIYA